MPKGFFKPPKKETSAKQSANGKKSATNYWKRRDSIERMRANILRLQECLTKLALLQAEMLAEIAENERQIAICLDGDHQHRLATPKKSSTACAAPVNGFSK